MTRLYPLPYLKTPPSRDKASRKGRGRKQKGLPPEKIVVMGASAGGIDALRAVLESLPKALPLAVLVVQHLQKGVGRTHLPDILGRSTRLYACEAEEDMDLEAGVVYVAAPGRHLLVQEKGIALGDGVPVRHVKPSSDVLFQSAAAAWGPAVIGVVLSGTGSDGAEGCRAVKRGCGITIAQDPKTADFGYMPEAAIRTGSVDHVLPVEAIGDMISSLVIGGGGTGETHQKTGGGSGIDPFECGRQKPVSAPWPAPGIPGPKAAPEKACEGTLPGNKLPGKTERRHHPSVGMTRNNRKPNGKQSMVNPSNAEMRSFPGIQWRDFRCLMYVQRAPVKPMIARIMNKIVRLVILKTSIDGITPNIETKGGKKSNKEAR